MEPRIGEVRRFIGYAGVPRRLDYMLKVAPDFVNISVWYEMSSEKDCLWLGKKEYHTLLLTDIFAEIE